MLAAMFFVSGCINGADETSEEEQTEEMPEEESAKEMNLVDTAIAAGNFTTLVEAVQEAELVDTLSGEGPFTIFAPTNEAFAELPEGMLEDLLADKEKLRAVLTYHVIAGEYMASDLLDLDSVVSIQGEALTIETTAGVQVNNAKVLAPDVKASNGVIHVIDKVLLPPSMEEAEQLDLVDTAIAAGSFDILIEAIQTAGLEETLRGDGPFTIFAPNDAAFEALPEGELKRLLNNPEELASILTYHVSSGKLMAEEVLDLESIKTLQGDSLSVNSTESRVGDAKIISTDIEASNGVIHVIDKVLLLPE
ncbi:MAG: fasciclin domain-containing protein [Methanosarcinaceae archaeon]|nr:fasciclin domain-containing protein [Methanosarcinaceae archaeon]MDD4330860.1 fasciclin domain-containing protein [Methanosarcinaceae archaeon]